MPKKSWTVQLEDGTHAVEMEHNLFSNQRTIRVDGEIVEQGKFSTFDFGGDYPFLIGERQAVLHMRMNGVWYKYDVSLGGFSVQTGKPVWPMQPMPRWSWIFVVACFLIPVITLGGLIPVLIGAGGAYVCAVAGRSATRTTPTKVALSVGTTLLSWVLLIAFLSTVTGGRTLLTLGQPAWQEYQSQVGRYSVLMPGRPSEQTQAVNSAVGPLDMHVSSVEDRSGAYLVMYVDYPADLIRSDQANEILDGAVQGAVANVNGQLVRQQNFPLGAVPGREIEFEAPAQGNQPATRIKVRYFLTNDRLYQVMVVAQQSQGLLADTQKFLDSFNLIEN